MIADNVGDNVGDCAGMAADLFETYAVTAVAVMLLGVTAPAAFAGKSLWLYPLAIGGVSIIASIIGVQFARVKAGGNIMNALYRAVIVATVISAALFIPVTKAFIGSPNYSAVLNTIQFHTYSFGALYGSALIGLAITALLVGITEYYTGTRWNPVKSIAQRSQTGHATNIIEGLAVGMQATALPVIVIAIGILLANHFAGLFGIGVAVMAQLSMTGLIVALDAYGPVTDNAGGIAEMADLPPEVRAITDPLDAVGNTTKAVTKGYAIGSAALAALVLFGSYSDGLAQAGPADALPAQRRLGDRRPPDRRPDAVPVRFARDAGGRPRRRRGRGGGAPPVPRAPGDHGGHRAAGVRPGDRHRHGLGDPLDDRCPRWCRSLFPIIVGLISAKMLGGLLIGTIVTGLFLAIAMTAGGGAWDNAKKLIEDGLYGGKGSEAHAAAVTGDTVGDPYKDTAGPAINPMIKITNIVAILIIPLLISIHG